jgi:outer membrane murein-binding lipoprotein Lpp
MGVESLTYIDLADRLGTTQEAARSLVRRLRLPRHAGNDGKVRVNVDLSEIQYKRLPARSPGGHRADIDALNTRIQMLQAELARLEVENSCMQASAAGHRADFERERDRTDQMVTAQDRLFTELENLRALLQTAQQPATPQPASRLVRAWRWMRATA